MEKERISIFIDLNNVQESMVQYNTSGLYLDYSDMVRAFVGDGKLAKVRVYDSIPGKNDELRELHESLSSNGFEVIEKRPQAAENNPLTTCVQKEVDTALVADVVKFAYKDEYDTAIIVSGDRDMNPAVECAEEIGKTVRVAGFYDNMCREFRDERENSMIIDDMYIMKFSSDRTYDVQVNCVSYSISEEAAADVL